LTGSETRSRSFTDQGDQGFRVFPERFVEWRIETLRPKFAHREVEIVTHFEPVPNICVPEDVLEKVVDGLLRNAIEALRMKEDRDHSAPKRGWWRADRP